MGTCRASNPQVRDPNLLPAHDPRAHTPGIRRLSAVRHFPRGDPDVSQPKARERTFLEDGLPFAERRTPRALFRRLLGLPDRQSCAENETSPAAAWERTNGARARGLSE